MTEKLTNTAGDSGDVHSSAALTGENLVRVGVVWELEASTAPVVVLSPHHSLVHTEPAQSRFQLQPARDERIVSQLGHLGLEIRAVSPPAGMKYF